MNIVGIGSIEQALKIDLKVPKKKKSAKNHITNLQGEKWDQNLKNCSLGNLFHLLGYIGYL